MLYVSSSSPSQWETDYTELGSHTYEILCHVNAALQSLQRKVGSETGNMYRVVNSEIITDSRPP